MIKLPIRPERGESRMRPHCVHRTGERGLLYASLAWSGLWVLGTLIAIELLVQGAGWLYFGIALRLTRSVAR